MGSGALPQSLAWIRRVRRVGVIVAMPWEAHRLIGHYPADDVEPLGKDTELRISGIGAERAERTAHALAQSGAAGLMSCGLAGGLQPRLVPGTVIVADAVIDTDGTRWTTDDAWVRDLVRRQSHWHAATVLCSDSPVTETHEKSRLYTRYQAAAVDMESAAVARVASQNRLPLAVLRVIVDPAWLAVPAAAFEALDPRGRVRAARLARGLLRHPTQTGALVHLALCRRDAGAALEDVAQRLRGGWGPP